METKENNVKLDDAGLEQLKELGQVEKEYQEGILTISIIGEIEGHLVLDSSRKATKYEHLIPLIVDASQNPAIKGILLLINTMGGDVEAGLAIAELISGIEKPSVSLVLGGGHSIGVPLAVCTTYSFIAPTATMTIHPIRMNGLIVGASQSFTYIRRMQDRIVEYVVAHSHINKKDFNALMMETDELATDVGSVLVGGQAVKAGIIDEVGSVSLAIQKLKTLMNTNSNSSSGSSQTRSGRKKTNSAQKSKEK